MKRWVATSSAKCILFFAFAIIATNVFSSDRFQSLQLSRTAALYAESAIKSQFRFLPSYGGFWLDGELDGKAYSLLVTRKEPETIANKFSMERYWKDSLAFSQSIGQQSQDLGCKSVKTYAYRCDRTVEERAKRFAAEAVVWNSKSDLILVRAMSSVSIEHARDILRRFDIRVNDRLPAGLNK